MKYQSISVITLLVISCCLIINLASVAGTKPEVQTQSNCPSNPDTRQTSDICSNRKLNLFEGKSRFVDINKYKFSLKSKKNSFKRGEIIAVKVTLKNTGLNTIKIPYQMDGEEYSANSFNIVGEKEQSPPLSIEGRKLVETPHIGSVSAKELNHGEEYVYELRLDKLYDLPAGTYSISINRNLLIKSQNLKSWETVEIESDSMEINIIE